MMNAQILDEFLVWLRTHVRKEEAQLRSDSRMVQVGDAFFAFSVPGSEGDGREFIDDAIRRGASAIVYELDGFDHAKVIPIAHRGVSQLMSVLGEIASAWNAYPDRGMACIAVTGTNGKTSCSQWIANAMSRNGKPCAVIGTLGVGTYDNGNLSSLKETGYTTPDALQLQRQLADLRSQGVSALAIEASSIGLDQGRLNGMHIDIALFTNFTRDHLDYHKSLEAYGDAKAKLFEWPGLRAVVVNVDDPYGDALATSLVTDHSKIIVLRYSIEEPILSELEVDNADQQEAFDKKKASLLRASHLKTTHIGTTFWVSSLYGSGHIRTRLVGRFNVSNVLGVLGVLLLQGIEWDQAVSAIEQLGSVPGRMQQLGSQGHVLVIVDYAHTPDALEKTLQALQQVAQERQGELWCVFGCGGDRDRGKRPQMGKIAQIAQHVVVTSDNPRTEDPSQIIDDIVQGMTIEPFMIADRASAILYAVKNAGVNDVILLAGKGHENYQDINGKKWPFSDEEHARLALATVATNNTMRRSV